MAVTDPAFNPSGNGADIEYDSIGVGAFAGAHFQALNKKFGVSHGYHRFNASDGVVNPDDPADQDDPKSPANGDYYANLKAQTWWDVARRFRNTFNAVTREMHYEPHDLISISPDCDHLDRLIDELATPRRDFDNAGRVKVESKKDLSKRKVASPNLADAFVMANAPRQKKPPPPKTTTTTMVGMY